VDVRHGALRRLAAARVEKLILCAAQVRTERGVSFFA
jgi:hypothetical protein